MLVIRNYSLLYYKTSAGRSYCMLEVALKKKKNNNRLKPHNVHKRDEDLVLL